MSSPAIEPAEPQTGPAALYTAPFLGILLIWFLVYDQNFIIQPILPLLVLEHGGDAALVGVVFAVYSIPSVVLRPWIGRLADRFGARRVLLGGALGLGIAGPAYLVGSLPLIVANRILHGTAWAAINTGNPVMMARNAPVARRGEAAGMFDLMPGLAQLVMPSIGLLIYATVGTPGVFAVAALLGLAAAGVLLVAIPASMPAGQAVTSSGSRALLEPAAILPMTCQLLFSSVSSLFLIYPPLVAAQHGIPVTDLALYYPIYGLTLVVVRFATGRVIDRLPRILLIAGGAAVAVVALAIAWQAATVLALCVAGALYAAAAGFSSPAMLASVMDRTPPNRLGAAMATYTLGFQFGIGIGAALWGFVIASSGFAPAYVVGAAIQVALLALVLRSGAGLARQIPVAGS